MRLHRLEVTGFGPFGTTETVDLDRLSAAGLFLLSGPTGAGKTSVLDAICFALYGRVPGARHDGDRLVSDHRPLDVEPAVVLEATIAGRRIRVRRVPAHQRPARRGSGTVEAKPAATLEERRDGAWVPISSSLQEVGAELTVLLGMKLDQFAQVVLLPQGGFATFLRANAEDRQALLGRLFDAERFGAAERWLADEATRTRTARDEAAQEADVQIAEIAATCGPTGAPDGDGDTAGVASSLADAEDATSEPSRDGLGRPDVADPAAVAGWLDRLESVLASDAAAADEARASARTAHDEAQQRSGAAQRRAELVDRRRALAAREERLRADTAVRTADRAALQRARAAEPARGPRRDAVAARAAAHDKHGRLEKARAWVDALEDDGLTGAESGTWAPARDRRRREHDELQALEALESGMEKRRRDRGATASEVAAAARRATTADATAAELLAARPDLARRGAEASALAGRAADLALAATAAAERLRAGQGRDELRGRHAEAEARHVAATDRHQQAVDVAQAVRERRLSGMASELASGLVDAAPCPVCGAVDHPAPARPTDDAAGAEDEERARAAAATAEAARESARFAVADLENRIAAAVAVSGDEPVEELTSASAAADADARAAHAATTASEALRTALDAHDARTDEARGASAAARAEEASGAATLRAADEALAVDEERLRVARGADGSVLDRRRRLHDEVRHLERALAVLDEATQASQALQDAEARLAEALLRAGLADEAALRGALVDPAELSAIETRLRAFDDETAAVADGLRDASLAGVDPAEQVDLVGPQERERAARGALDAAVAASATAEHRAAELRRRRPVLEQALAALEPLAERAATAGSLARLAAGSPPDNQKRMRLEAYVLAARLEEVAEVASAMLLRMSDGRYGLVHHDERGRGGGRSGLGLRVTDGWTGEHRDTRTLSGGESFFASLALALALADVVTRESGGRPLDTIFIDEGFGSLDEDTLEQVMEVLEDLRDGGRVVGIVSHVADLRSRVQTQLRVTKRTDGSSLSIATADAL